MTNPQPFGIMNDMKATQKNPALDAFLSMITGKDRTDTVASAQCATCDGEAVAFRDALSEREYQISGMCQSCQDEVFGK